MWLYSSRMHRYRKASVKRTPVRTARLSASLWSFIAIFHDRPLDIRVLSKEINSHVMNNVSLWNQRYNCECFKTLLHRERAAKKRLVKKGISARCKDGSLDLHKCFRMTDIRSIALNNLPFKQYQIKNSLVFLSATFSNTRISLDESDLTLTIVRNNVDPNARLSIRVWSLNNQDASSIKFDDTDNYTISRPGGVLLSLWKHDQSLVSITAVVPLWDLVKDLFPLQREPFIVGDKLTADVTLFSVDNNQYTQLMNHRQTYFHKDNQVSVMPKEYMYAYGIDLNEIKTKKHFHGWRLNVPCIICSVYLFNDQGDIVASCAEFAKLEEAQPGISFDITHVAQLWLMSTSIECSVHIGSIDGTLFFYDIRVQNLAI